MTNRTADISLRKAAIVAGLGLLIMTISAVWAYFVVFSQLVILPNQHPFLFHLQITSVYLEIFV